MTKQKYTTITSGPLQNVAFSLNIKSGPLQNVFFLLNLLRPVTKHRFSVDYRICPLIFNV